MPWPAASDAVAAAAESDNDDDDDDDDNDLAVDNIPTGWDRRDKEKYPGSLIGWSIHGE